MSNPNNKFLTYPLCLGLGSSSGARGFVLRTTTFLILSGLWEVGDCEGCSCGRGGAQWSQHGLKATGTCIYLEITVTRFIQSMPILTPPSSKLVLGSNPFSLAHIL